MLFTQIEFFVFMTALLGGLAIVQSNNARKVILLAASYYFYAYWDWRFLGLLAVTTLSDYQIGKYLSRTADKRKRKFLITASLLINLGILAGFKYFNFFLSSMQAILAPIGVDTGTLPIIMPLGISFYTFRSLSYTIDVHRGKIPPCEMLLDYAVFISFFPTMVAGPIVRASELLPQLTRPVNMTFHAVVLGFKYFITGLFLKIFVADRIASFTNFVFDNAGVFGSGTIWLAAVGYSIQLYCDFAGYSMMAIGLSRAMGYEIPENFNFPYLSRNISDFWKRWHITLSDWIRDYVYISLGGNRKGAIRTYVNLLAAMTLCGLWHGAAWTFVFWGFFHGAALVIQRLWQNMNPGAGIQSAAKSVFAGLFSRAITLLTVVVGWVFFRANDFEIALSMLGKMFFPVVGVDWFHPFVIFILVVFVLIQFAELFRWGDIHRLPVSAWYTPTIIFTMILLSIIFQPKEFAPFIYSQF